MIRKLVTVPFHFPHKRSLFLSTFPPNQTTIQTLCSNGRLGEALLEMAVQDINKTGFHDYDAILNECVKNRALREGQRVHSHMIKTHYLPSLYLRTRLIILYSKSDQLSDAHHVFDEMPDRTVVSWTALISAYSRKGFSVEASELFIRMMRSGSESEPNEFTFASLLSSSDPKLGTQIHSMVAKRNLESHVFVGSSLLDMYAKSGMIEDARKVFEGLSEYDIVSCTAMISGYAQLGLDGQALELFRELTDRGMVPNYVTYTSLLTALSGLAALDLGKQVHSHFLRSKTLSFVVLQNSLIDMYSKCGDLVYARRVFDKTGEKSVISWNAMLVGYAKHGMGKQVVELFDSMVREGKVKPVSVTFLAVLSGCSHGGMEEKGLELFRNIKNPEISHYACVVDLLGRAGRIKEAFKFIEKMPFEPTAAFWGSLLGACRVYSNLEIGKIAGQKLLEIEPENAGNYVILSNLYASAGKWDEVRAMRDSMREKAVTKEPGVSLIEVDRTVHGFRAGERSHPRRLEIKAKIEELSVEFKRFGYVPDLSCVLFDVDDEQKEKILLSHGEKLAMAFGLIASPEGKSIRIIKNLRICIDCHNFAKIFSKVCGREICLRDKTRFHCIVDGICSCKDYW